jgi:hypothetical protein
MPCFTWHRWNDDDDVWIGKLPDGEIAESAATKKNENSPLETYPYPLLKNGNTMAFKTTELIPRPLLLKREGANTMAIWEVPLFLREGFRPKVRRGGVSS